MNPTAAHPSAPDLTAFALGKLSPPSAETVAQHITECDSCRTTVESASADGLMNLIRDAARTGTDSPLAVTPSAFNDPTYRTEPGRVGPAGPEKLPAEL